MPFVSQYSDCTEANQCSGCTRCTCTAEGIWSCRVVEECPAKIKTVDEDTLDKAFKQLYSQLQNQDSNSLVPSSASPKSSEDLLLDTNDRLELKIIELMKQSRMKREIKEVNEDNDYNNTVKFYNTVDDINEDTLKNSNISGTLRAQKIKTNGTRHLRRTGLLLNGVSNNTEDNPLQIEHGKHQLYNHHIDDNKLDEDHTEDPNVIIKKDREIGIVANQTQKEKDAELSKLLVNELKTGHEFIGDRNAPIMSNITFTPENDTLTAMAFIAGNLLNKLWSMEKDASEEVDAAEVERMKHEKIADLLELFKEPLTIRQEMFLKNTLEKLSEAMVHNLDPKNLTLCENVAEVKRLLDFDTNNSTFEKSTSDSLLKTPDALGCNNHGTNEKFSNSNEKKNNSAFEAISKINNVLNLIKKYETINQHLDTLKRIVDQNPKEAVSDTTRHKKLGSGEESDNENEPLNLFGNILAKITKLIMPNQIGKKIVKKIGKQNFFATDENKIKEKVKSLFQYDLGNVTLSPKDKLVLDYLTKLETNPRHLLKDEELDTPKSRLKVEGDILLNLSEFFKMKSFVDLLKHLGPGNDNHQGLLRVQVSEKTTMSPDDFEKETEAYREVTIDKNIEELTTEEESATKQTKTTKASTKINYSKQEIVEMDYEEMTTQQAITKIVEASKRFENTKAKFKSHLKAILDDLVELQKEYGINAKEGELKIADALPCIYNILKSGKETDETITKLNSSVSPMKKIAAIFETLKKELKVASVTERRTMNKVTEKEMKQLLLADRPKSAIVWERVVKTVDDVQNRVGRRTNFATLKAYEQIKDMIDDVALKGGSNSYKILALQREVHPASRLMLLNTLLLDVKKYLGVLQALKSSINNFKDLDRTKESDIVTFVDNAAITIDLDKRVLYSLGGINKTFSSVTNNFVGTPSKGPVESTYLNREDMKMAPVFFTKYQDKYEIDEPKLTIKTKYNQVVEVSKDEILNQLVKNRVQMYLKYKEMRGENVKTDMYYNIANSILNNLEKGNFGLARELYRELVNSKTTQIQQSGNLKAASPPSVTPRTRVKLSDARRPDVIMPKVPLVQFEDIVSTLKRGNSNDRDALLKQLLDLKNLKMAK